MEKSLKQTSSQISGPKSIKEFFTLYVKAFAIGSADLIPGISGGTVAFITGIYEDLLNAINSLHNIALKPLIQLKLKSALQNVHSRFLLTIALGILSAVVLIARPMHYLFTNHTVLIWSAFFGLIAASTCVLLKKQKEICVKSDLITLIMGAIVSYIIVGVVPVSTTNDLWFIFICGIISIMAMMLPGISGSFLLLMLGKYGLITGAIKDPFNLANFVIIAIFTTGALVGMISFGKFLKWLITTHRNKTMAFLIGVLIGSLRKTWPWKEAIEHKIINGKIRILRENNIVPNFDIEAIWAITIIFVSFFIVIWLESLNNKKA